MIISSMTLTNFRQYYGEQKLDLSPNSDCNIVLIHAENTFGKTAFLNAFTWCLYGKVTSLPNPTRIFSNKTLAETKIGGEIITRVQMDFENEDSYYTVVRTQKFSKLSSNSAKPIGAATCSLSYRDSTGKSHRPQNPQNHINIVLPEEMHPYFFFDGEDMDKLAMAESKEKIKTAIRNLMDLTTIDRGIHHLNSVSKKFRSEVKGFGNIESHKIGDELDEIETKISDYNNSLNDFKKQLNALQEELHACENQLKSIGPAKELQEKKMKLQEQGKEQKEKMIQVNNELIELIAKKGCIPFFTKAVDEVITDLEDKREKKVLPAGIRDNFINDLLQDGICICGTNLNKNEKAKKAIEEYLKHKACASEIEDTANRLSGVLISFKDINQQFKRGLKRLIGEKQEAYNLIRSITEQIDDIKLKLKNNQDLEEIPRLEQKIEDIGDKIDEYKKMIIRTELTIEQYNNEKGELESEFKKIEGLSSQMDLNKRRVAVCNEASELLKEINEILVNEVRSKVHDKINEILKSVTGNDIHAEITDDFHLLTKEFIGKELSQLDKSTAQNQITSLSFIGALIDIAKTNFNDSQKQKQGPSLLRGGLFPLVMDSPFGTISNVFGPRMLKNLANLTPQIIMMLSPKQKLGLEDIINQNLSKEYILIRYKHKPTDADIKSGKLELHGRIIETVRETQDFPYTIVERIN